MKRHLFALLVVSLLAPIPAAWAQRQADFAGNWQGPWKNSLGERGKSTLDLTEHANGRLSGTWDGIHVKGRRTNGNSVELHGSNETRSYQITATVRAGTMTITYIVTRLDSRGTYTGEATLRRG